MTPDRLKVYPTGHTSNDDFLWCPSGDVQLMDGLTHDVNKKKRPLVDGRVAWRYDRQQAALDLLPEGRRRTAIDIGAHIGLWARWLARDFQRVVCFEPSPRHLACLYDNFIPDYPTPEVHEIALGDAYGRVQLREEIEVSGRTHIMTSGEGVEVEIHRLDEWVYAFDEVDLIKIDVEGYESRVLHGAYRTITSHRPLIIIEQLGHEERYGERDKTALDILTSWGMIELRPNMKGDYYMGWPT